jgi:DNA replication protein DnaC
MASDAVCPKCGGTGFLIVERANVSGAEPCDCRQEDREERLLANSRIPPLYLGKSFDNFRVPGTEHPVERGQLTTVLLAVKGFVHDFPNEKRPGLLLMGDVGTGKTHLAVAALRQIIEKGHQGLFYSYQNLLNSIVKGFNPASGSSDRDAYQSALDAEVLLLDDLAANRAQDWVEDTVNSIITYRCDHRKALIATTNAPDKEAGKLSGTKNVLGNIEYARTLEDYIGSRARSRLFEMCTVVRMPAVRDYRVANWKIF